MPIDAEGRWRPPLFPKQEELLRACLPGKKNLILANGPRYSGKTVSALAAVAQHAWNTDRGNICLLTITQSVGIDSGVWADLTDVVLPQWIEDGNFGMEWVKKPYIQNVTKKPACSVTNRFGNKTTICLESLRNEDEVEARFKGKRYSMIFVNELSKFTKRKTFDTLKQALRMLHLKEHEHIFLCDTNPADDGEQSWIWKLFYQFRNCTDDELASLYPHLPSDTLIPLRDSLNLIEFTIDDNLACSPEKKASLMADFAHDDDLLQRYFYGKWVAASEDALFFKVFRPKFHVVGQIEMPTIKEPEIIVPHENTTELITGLDPGGTNCSFHILEKLFPDKKLFPQYNGKPIFNVLDELVIVGEDFDLQDFIEEMVSKMNYWERLAGKEGKILWRHWSDRSVFDMRIPFSQNFWHQEIRYLSGGKIAVQAAERGKGSVGMRIDLFRKLLFEDRVFFNNNFCEKTIEMVKGIRKGTTVAGGIQRGTPHKHPFDSLTYALASECTDELSQSIMQQIRNMKKQGGDDSSSLVSVKI